MYRLFIVDDNVYERNGLKKRIDWERLGVEVVGDFEDGAEAFGRIGELQPDIIITDIAMPVMNGIEMSEKVRKLHPDIKVIFISCHSDFDFAKSAVDLGVYSYVLKPIISDELVVAVRKLVHDLDAAKLLSGEKERMLRQIDTMLPFVQEQFFKELLLGNINDETDIRKRMAFLKLRADEQAGIRVLSFQLHDLGRWFADKDIEDAYFVSYSVKNVIASMRNDRRLVYPVQISGDGYAAIVLETAGENGATNLAVDIIEEIGEKLNVAVTIGISKRGASLADVSSLYRQSQKALHTKFYSGGNPVIAYEEIEDRTDSPSHEMPNLELFYQDIKTLLAYGGSPEIRAFADKYLNDRTVQQDGEYLKGFEFFLVNVTRIVLLEMNQSLKAISGDDVAIWKGTGPPETLAEVRGDICVWLTAIIGRLAVRSTSKHGKIVESIKEIIHKRYREQITIDEISKSVYLSARHANALFKQETGSTIFDYVIEVRIGKAKQLLREADSRVAAVAETTGYLSTSYFCLAFKKNVGMTPAEYKNKVVRE